MKVLSPFLGDLDEVQSPCGAPRLVACSEEGLRAAEALLKYIEGLLKSSGVYDVIKFLPRAWTCEKPFVIPELVEINVPNEVVADWPLGNPLSARAEGGRWRSPGAVNYAYVVLLLDALNAL